MANYQLEVEFDYLGRSYKYDLAKHLMFSDVIDEDRRRVVAEIAFISTVLAHHQIKCSSLKNKLKKSTGSSKSIATARNAISKKTGKDPHEVNKQEVESYIRELPENEVLQEELEKYEHKVLELENAKWDLITKKDMLTVIRN